MRFMSYFPLFLICISQYYLQGANANNLDANELIDYGEKLTQQSEQLFKKMAQRKKRDYYGTFGHDSWDRRTLGPKYDDVKEKLTKIYSSGN
ncbi:Hypothetical protein SRAE_X000055700 [Strongyloides ratti]|uniref:Uncharacterized protein n=1 Tax=Strongyloides ratti TaxID=34506 RepID=A0A090LN30_STRRB|nr:Hypothetical protein SRAE_X000055700 [Strongyloides ratti]CEF71230.1 Hypothetical protein SRAE_X000055700 [Strongyloides ratti]